VGVVGVERWGKKNLGTASTEKKSAVYIPRKGKRTQLTQAKRPASANGKGVTTAFRICEKNRYDLSCFEGSNASSYSRREKVRQSKKKLTSCWVGLLVTGKNGEHDTRSIHGDERGRTRDIALLLVYSLRADGKLNVADWRDQ